MEKINSKILIVEDNQPNAMLLQNILEGISDDVQIAYDGKQALQILENNDFDLILLDIMMPGISGFEVCINIKNNPSKQHIPIIFLTAKNFDSDIDYGFSIGASDYVTKPYRHTELVSRIKVHLELQLHRKHLEQLVSERTAELEKYKNHLEELVEQKTLVIKESEAKFRQLTENIIETFWLEESGKIIYLSPAFSEMFGLSKERILENNFYSNILGDEKYLTQISNQDTLLYGEVYEFKINHPQKGVRFIRAKRFPIYQNNNEIIRKAGIAIDITEEKLAERKILNTIINTEESEKRRFAKDLHDGLGPLLSTIKLYLKGFESIELPEKQQYIIHKTGETIDEAIQCIKDIANNLSPHILERFGLNSALKSFIQKIIHQNKPEIILDFDQKERFDPKIEITLFRITIELINNALKHSNAKKILIKIIKNQNIIEYQYSDNGIGFDVTEILQNNMGMGLQNIISRIKSLNGDIEFECQKDKGCKVNIAIDLNNL